MSEAAQHCPACRYDLAGVEVAETPDITCPECGRTWSPSRLAELRKVPVSAHARARKSFVVPMLGAYASVLLLSFLPFPLGSLITICGILLLLPILSLVLCILTIVRAAQDTRHRGKDSFDMAIIMWVLLYLVAITVPGVLLLYWRYTAIALHV